MNYAPYEIYLLKRIVKAMIIAIAMIIPTINEKRLFFLSSSVGGSFLFVSLISSLSFSFSDVVLQ